MFVVQLLAARSVRVLGIASKANAEWLRSHDVVPVPYGDGLAERLLDAARPGGVPAFIDLFGPEYLDLAVDLGVPVERMETAISSARAGELSAKTAGTAGAAICEDLTQLADLAVTGAVEVPIATTYPPDVVADASTDLERRRTRGNNCADPLTAAATVTSVINPSPPRRHPWCSSRQSPAGSSAALTERCAATACSKTRDAAFAAPTNR